MLSYLADVAPPENRIEAALAVALAATLLFGRFLIRRLRESGRRQPIRDDGPQRHLAEKADTPTMGGLMMIFGLAVALVLVADPRRPEPWIVLAAALAFGSIGLADDLLKTSRKSSRDGLSAKFRLLLEFALAVGIVLVAERLAPPDIAQSVRIPMIDEPLHIGAAHLPFAAFVIVGAANAVNLADGLDGLAVVPAILVAAVLGIAACVFADEAAEIVVVVAALVGAGIGFLWFNAPPAKIFMGDTGALAIGASLGTLAVLLNAELLFALAAGVFVVEALSVILQVASYKMRGGKRILLMAPLHHHFEKLGWSESNVVIRFWIVALGFAACAISTLRFS